MHQPIYYPYEPVTTTASSGRYTFDVWKVFSDRGGPYTNWPKDAVQSGSSLAHLGASVSFSGSLIENLNVLAANGGMWNNWSQGYRDGMALKTSLGNRRLDLVAFGYFHPLMPLLDILDMRMQIRLHKYVYQQTWGGIPYAKGMFPAENAFAERMIPALQAEGIEWVMVDNIHFDRACANYPWTNGSNLFPPNAADAANPDPAANGGAWVQLNNVWAPGRVSAPFGYQPHIIQYVDPSTGAATKMVAIPTARYEGNEDARGGYGAFLYDKVMGAYMQYNTDAAHPMFVVLHHDGDNYGGGTDSYYHSNFQNMVNWDSGDSNYECSTVDDYLARFPVNPSDVIHVEAGSWSGADNGDPEFKKWLGDPNSTTGWSPDRNSWAVLTAAKNRVFMAEALAPVQDMGGVLRGDGSNTEKAWHYLLCGEASDYWYWDGSSEPWDSNVTRACNQAATYADAAISGKADAIAPTVFIPQREPYNPGAYEWASTPMPSDFQVWTYVYDVSGLQGVALKWRANKATGVHIPSAQNMTYTGGSDVTEWNSVAMTVQTAPARPSNILAPAYIADQYAATVAGQKDVLVDYYVEAVDSKGNTQKTDIQHVYVGGGASPTPTGTPVVSSRVQVSPNPPVRGQNVTVSYSSSQGPIAGAGQYIAHHGEIYSTDWTNIQDAPMTRVSPTSDTWTVTYAVSADAPMIAVVFNDGNNHWDNNGGNDFKFATTETGPTPTVSPSPSPSPTGPTPTAAPPTATPSPSPTSSTEPPWTIDGNPETGITALAVHGLHLYVAFQNDWLYVATEADSANQNDHFILLTRSASATEAAPWAKAGTVPAWDYFLAAEGSNAWNSWFDSTQAIKQNLPGFRSAAAAGKLLEGAINLRTVFGTVPASVYLCVAPYTTADSGALSTDYQVPAPVVVDGNIQASEMLPFELKKKEIWLVR